MRYLTTGDVARRCQVTVGTVKNWIEAGQLEAFRTPGRHFRIPSSALRRFQATFGFPAAADDRPRILVVVVDDEADFVDLAAETLSDLLPQARIESAGGGYEALLKIGSFEPHVLILDLRMPALDGFEVCRRVKEAPESKGIKILATTGFVDAEAESLALACGADAFVGKLEGFGALGRRVRELLDGDAVPVMSGPSSSGAPGGAAGRGKGARPSRGSSGKRR
jgi:excisionase family DNA binding protein